MTIKEELWKLMNMEELARLLALKEFDGVVDKGGEKYLYHLERVAEGAIKGFKDRNIFSPTSADLLNTRIYIVGYLHDIIEDRGYTRESLIEAGITDEQVLDAIQTISHTSKSETYLDFIVRCKNNEIARYVKLSDLRDNMDVTRLKSFSPKDQKRVSKYWHCYQFLLDKMDYDTVWSILYDPHYSIYSTEKEHEMFDHSQMYYQKIQNS